MPRSGFVQLGGMIDKESFVFEFGPFTLDPGRGLSRAGTFVALPPKEFALMRTNMPWSDAAHGYVSVFASWLGFEDEAVEAGYRLLELSKNDSFAKAIMAYTLARTGNIEESRVMLKAAEKSVLPFAPRTHVAMVSPLNG